MKLVIHEAASAELEAAAELYDGEREGLGDEFLDEISRAVETVLESPRTWPVVEGGRAIRRFTLSRFPYVIYYVVGDNDVLVAAFGHTRRQPGYWRDRLRT